MAWRSGRGACNVTDVSRRIASGQHIDQPPLPKLQHHAPAAARSAVKLNVNCLSKAAAHPGKELRHSFWGLFTLAATSYTKTVKPLGAMFLIAACARFIWTTGLFRNYFYHDQFPVT
jgi:hypothetical protein